MIAIIDSGGANIASVQLALERLGAESILTKDVKIIQSADKVLLPGVGAAPIAMQNLAEYGLIDCIRDLTQPVMGICIGMQLLFAASPEGNTPLLGIFDADCKTFSPRARQVSTAYGLEPAVKTARPPFIGWGWRGGARLFCA